MSLDTGIIRFVRLDHKIYNPKFDQNQLRIDRDISIQINLGTRVKSLDTRVYMWYLKVC